MRLRCSALRQRIEELTDELLRRALTRRQFDLVAEYALPLPTTTIAQLIGVPPEDRHRFHDWSAKVVSLSPSPVRFCPEARFAAYHLL